MNKSIGKNLKTEKNQNKKYYEYKKLIRSLRSDKIEKINSKKASNYLKKK